MQAVPGGMWLPALAQGTSFGCGPIAGFLQTLCPRAPACGLRTASGIGTKLSHAEVLWGTKVMGAGRASWPEWPVTLQLKFFLAAKDVLRQVLAKPTRQDLLLSRSCERQPAVRHGSLTTSALPARPLLAETMHSWLAS